MNYNQNIICFSENRNDFHDAFKDYMYHYISETQGKTDIPYNKSRTFAEKEKKISSKCLGEVFKLAQMSQEAMPNVSREMLASHPNLRWAVMAVSTNLIDMIIPDILIKSNGIYTETRNGDWGDNFKFVTESNDLFYVSKSARNQRTVEFQKQYPGIATVTPHNHQIAVAVDFYKVLCGMESLAKFVMKAALSIEAEITKECYMGFDTAMSQLPTTPVDQELQITGWDAKKAVRIAQTVTAFNRSQATFIGTKLALNDILPKDANYRYWLDSEYVTLGYIRDFSGFGVMELPQVADWQNPYKTVLKDNRIYVFSPGSQKPVKLCFEGATMSRTLPNTDHADLTEYTTINKSWGIGIHTNAIAGVINLA